MPNNQYSHETVRSVIDGDIETRKLRETVAQTEEAMKSLVSAARENLYRRIGRVVVDHGLGHMEGYGDQRIFDNEKFGRKEIDGVTIATFEVSDEIKEFYYSRQLHMWVKGVPERRGNDSYCQITGDNISY